METLKEIFVGKGWSLYMIAIKLSKLFNISLSEKDIKETCFYTKGSFEKILKGNSQAVTIERDDETITRYTRNTSFVWVERQRDIEWCFIQFMVGEELKTYKREQCQWHDYRLYEATGEEIILLQSKI